MGIVVYSDFRFDNFFTRKNIAQEISVNKGFLERDGDDEVEDSVLVTTAPVMRWLT